MLESVFRDLGLTQDEASVRLVKDAITALPKDHPVWSYIHRATDLTTDGAVVDAFLHVRQRSYTVRECLELVESAGLAFQGWFYNTPYYPHDLRDPASEFRSALNRLPDPALWSVMERLHTTNATHFFMACRPERPRADYAIDFSRSGSLDYVPMSRTACLLSGDEISKPGAKFTLNPAQLEFVRQIDGRSTIREIVARVAHSGNVAHDAPALLEFGQRLFESLWRLDVLAMATDIGH
jgi:hypothetical protein